MPHNYTNQQFLKKRERRQSVIDIANAHPDWNILQIREEQQRRYPGYTDTAVRMALRDAGINRAMPRNTKRGPRPVMECVKCGRRFKYKKCPKCDEVKVEKRMRAVCHSYSGRSRLSASYVELL